MPVLVDTNFLISVLLANDINHAQAKAAVAALRSERRIVAAPVLVELFHLIEKLAGYPAAVKSIQQTQRLYTIEPLLNVDLQAMENITLRYQSAEFDYTDEALMVLSERLKINRIYTFDRRDFSIYRPVHCTAYDLLP
jgi:predicted nucleic acid-binding protein